MSWTSRRNCSEHRRWRQSEQAFGASDLDSLRRQLRSDYGATQPSPSDYRLRVFVERAVNTAADPDRWLDGIAGHLTGKRLANWPDDMLDKFRSEIRGTAETLDRWLALARNGQPHPADLTSVHVVGIDGRERVVVVRRERPKPHLDAKLSALRRALGDEPQAVEVLSQLLAEYAADTEDRIVAKEARQP